MLRRKKWEGTQVSGYIREKVFLVFAKLCMEISEVLDSVEAVANSVWSCVLTAVAGTTMASRQFD